MQRLKNYAMLSLTIAALSFSSTTSSQMQESSPSRTQQPEQQQGSLTPPTKFMKSRRPIPNRYIVVLNDDVVSSDEPLEVRRARITAIASSHAQTYGGKFDHVYETALKGYAIELPNEAAAVAISNLPEVRWVEEESLFTVDMRADTASSKSFELPGSSKDTGSVCRGKSVPVSLMEHPFGMKESGRRGPFLFRGISLRARLVIRSRDEFNELWKGLFRSGSDKPALPEIDFSREMIIVAAMGQRGTSGYEILIDGACEIDHRLEVMVRSTNYLKCRGAYMVETEPLDIVRFPKTDLPVVFRETDVTSD